jgi:DNA repair photolyase
VTRPVRGRGAGSNPASRFDRLVVEPDPEADEEGISPRTELLSDTTRQILSRNTSPDLPFDVSLNPYRGCEHGCSYCYARPTHEYLGFSAGLDFETKILVKESAPELLRRELSSPRYEPSLLALSGVTDPYQPVERRLRLVRRCLEVLAELRHPVGIVTKNHLVTRDLDLLQELARYRAAVVFLSITTLDPELSRVMEPRASHPRRRLDAIRALSQGGVPVAALMAPIVPALTDEEIPRLLEAVADAGALDVCYILLRLPYGLKEQFTDWLRTHRPQRAAKVLNRIRSLRGGALDDTEFGRRQRGTGIWAEQIAALFEATRRRLGLPRGSLEVSSAAFRRPGGEQMSLFE